MLVKNPENCDAKQHGSRVRGTVIMHTIGKVYKYVAERNDQGGKTFCYL